MKNRNSARIVWQKGNIATEYGVMSAVVLLIVLSPLLNLGQGLNTNLAKVKGDMGNHAESEHQVQRDDQQRQDNEYPRQVGGNLCYSATYCLNHQVVQSQSQLEVSGANGARQYIHDQGRLLAQIAKQAQSDPHTDPALLDLLQTLAADATTIGNNLEHSVKTIDSDYNKFFWDYDSFWRSQGPYDGVRDQLFAYLKENPEALPPGVQEAVHGATSAINAELALLIAGDGPNYTNWNAMMSNPANIYHNASSISNSQQP